MPQFFGFNDDAQGHTAGRRTWQPGRLSPNAFRFGVGWDAGVGAILGVCNAMKLGSLPANLGIVTLGPGSQAPDSGSFYNRVKEYLDGTPGNLMVQVWNEPNIAQFGNLPPETTRALISSAVKADGGRGRIIGPAMAPVGNWEAYMQNAYIDHTVPAAVHIYPRSNPWTADFDNAIKQASLANAVYVNPTRPIYITEMAMLARFADGTVNYGWFWANLSRDAYVRASQQSNVRAVMFHRLWYGSPPSPFDVQGLTYFLDQNNNETLLVDRLDEVR